MTATIQQIAEAFSGHRFADAVDHLAPHVLWETRGGPTVQGRDEVVVACESTTTQLQGVTTEFPRFVSVVGQDAVAVDVVARYTGPDGTFTVSSCDVYEFEGGALARITSYVAELPDGS